jgi:16S rRNA (uracil1498-N3)-methyltransferase
MKAPLRVPVFGVHAGPLELPSDTARYVFRVHRAKPGQVVILFDPEAGLEAEATIGEDHTLLVASPREVASSGLAIHLLQTVGKQDKPEQVLRDATVLGAERVTLLHSERSVAKSGSEARQKRFRRVIVEAARQSGRGDLLALEGPLDFDAALASARGELRVVCAPQVDARSLCSVVEQSWTELGRAPSIDLLIGPEGGFSPTEIERAQATGFRCVSLGPLVLRTETAATAVLGFLRFWFERAAR